MKNDKIKPDENKPTDGGNKKRLLKVDKKLLCEVSSSDEVELIFSLLI